jgi:hypothetical protein
LTRSQLPDEQRSNGRGSFVVHRGQDVRVGLKGDGDVGVAEAFLNYSGVYALLQRDRGPGVEEAVNRDHWLQTSRAKTAAIDLMEGIDR